MARVPFRNKEAILDIAVKCFARRGYKGTTMNQIAKACGMTKASLYYYFPSKKELYREVLKKIYTEMSEAFTSSMAENKDYIERAKELVSFTIDFMASNRELAELTMRALMDKDRVILDMVRKEGKVLVDSLKVFIELGIKSGRLKNLPPEYIIQIALGVCVFHFISGEVGKVIFGDRDIFSKEVIEKYKETAIEILMGGLLRGEDETSS